MSVMRKSLREPNALGHRTQSMFLATGSIPLLGMMHHAAGNLPLAKIAHLLMQLLSFAKLESCKAPEGAQERSFGPLGWRWPKTQLQTLLQLLVAPNSQLGSSLDQMASSKNLYRLLLEQTPLICAKATGHCRSRRTTMSESQQSKLQ